MINITLMINVSILSYTQFAIIISHHAARFIPIKIIG